MALSHHVIVNWAAVIAGEIAENKYVILGDDIVIADPKIAKQYVRVIKALGIEISMAKSFTERHLAEFGKGWYRSGVDLKPLSPE